MIKSLWNDETELIFVYNADSGLWNGYLDIMHKVLSPKTYSCNLCAITYGTLSIKGEWQEFIHQLPVPVRFLHRDEWMSQFNRKDELPAVFLRKNNFISIWIDAFTMSNLQLEELKKNITKRLHELI